MSEFSLEGNVRTLASCCCGLDVLSLCRLIYLNNTWSPAGGGGCYGRLGTCGSWNLTWRMGVGNADHITGTRPIPCPFHCSSTVNTMPPPTPKAVPSHTKMGYICYLPVTTRNPKHPFLSYILACQGFGLSDRKTNERTHLLCGVGEFYPRVWESVNTKHLTSGQHLGMSPVGLELGRM